MDYLTKTIAIDFSEYELELFIAFCVAILIILSIVILSIVKKLKD